MDILRDLYIKYSSEIDIPLVENAEYKKLIGQFYEIIQANMEKQLVAKLDVLLSQIGDVIAEESCIEGMKLGARLINALTDGDKVI